MNIQILAVPYDSGQRGIRMGRGPLHFIEAGVETVLREAGHTVSTQLIEAGDGFRAENQTAFELNRSLAAGVRAAVEHGDFPLILSGNCNAVLGATSGLGMDEAGLIWFDAHGDFNTPETSLSGFLDGMALAVAAGRCWQGTAKTIPGYNPIPEQHIILVGGRDFDTLEKALLEQSDITLVEAITVQGLGVDASVTPALDVLRGRVKQVYIHFDFDVLDPSAATANHFAVPDGLNLQQIDAIFEKIADRFTISGIGFSAYDPTYDPDGRLLEAGFRLMKTILAVQ